MANRNARKIRILIIVIVALAAGAAVAFAFLYNIFADDSYDSLLKNPARSAPVLTPMPLKSIASQSTYPTSADPTDPPVSLTYDGKNYAHNDKIVSVLFLGVDYTEKRESLNLGSRSDMVLVCAVDTQAHSAALISIPRDTYTTINKIDEDTGEITDKTQNKINSAYSFGGGKEGYGAENAMSAVQLFMQRECRLENDLPFALDIPVYLYASIDIDGIAPVVSAVGGVEVTLDSSIPGVGKEGETVLLDGGLAQAYIRDRHNTPGGDIGRAGREQDFMKRLAKKVKDMGAAEAVLRLYGTLSGYVSTNLTTKQMIDLARVLSSVDIDSITTYTIPGKSGMKNGTSYYFADEDETLALLLKVYYKEII